MFILSIFGAVRGAHDFSSLCFVLCFVCRRPVSCVPNVVSVSRLSILDCPLRFSLTFMFYSLKRLRDFISYFSFRYVLMVLDIV